MERLSEETGTKAFELAYFIHRDRQLALQITREAWAALRFHLTPQRKRFYYRLSGRTIGGLAIKARTKINLEEAQKLQSLVYLRSERLEKEQEAKLTPRDPTPHAINLSDEDWLIRFVKHLAAITVTRSSFYVTLGIGRVIFNYTTEEAAKIYDAIIQDSNRMKDAPYFRKRKNEVLMKELKARFGELMQTRVVAHGEERFKSRSDSASFAPLVNQCLDLFTPWNTECALPARLDPLNEPIDELRFADDDPEKEHPIEARRMHTLIHPSCFARLVAALELASPNERLEVPMFFFQSSENGNQSGGGPQSGNNLASGSDRRPPSPLTNEELAEVETDLEKQNTRRRRANAEVMSVLVDGVERETIKLDQKPVRLRVEESARLIELKSQDAEGELLLGSLLLDYRELSGAVPSRDYHFRLAHGRELLVNLSPIPDANGDFAGADIEVDLRTAESFAGLAVFFESLRQGARATWRRPAFGLGILAMVAVVGAGIVIGVLKMRSSRPDYVAQVQPRSAPLASSAPQTSSSGTLGQNGSRNKSQPSPSDRGASTKPGKPGNAVEEGTRSLPSDTVRELASVRRIYVAESKNESEKATYTALVSAISAGSKVKIANEANADAYFYWDVKRVGPTQRIEARLMSRNGIVLWTASRLVGKDEDPGVVARAIGQDLLGRLTR